MKTKMRISFFTSLVLFVAFGLVSFIKLQKPWIVPDEYKNKTNPIKSSSASINEGKDLYLKNCSKCHGQAGLGDGPKAKLLDTSVGDFTDKAFQSQTDGEMFYKTWKGRGDMPGYKGKVSDDDIWKMIVFMRTLKK